MTLIWKRIQSRLICNKFYTVQLRNLFTIRKTFRPRHSKENIPREFVLIYENSLKNFISPCRLVSSGASVITIGFTVKFVLENYDTLQHWEKFCLASVCLFCLFFIFLANKLLNYYLIRIYYDEGTNMFIAIYHNFFGLSRQLKYSVFDLKLLQTPVANSLHIKSNVNIKGKTFHLRASDFILPKYYNWHIGKMG
ncbi:hypothetical protein Btru_053486 [Bulinus truncatus]|nr:hypothetical protein Btru_053486 [Bulinus truncatus]